MSCRLHWTFIMTKLTDGGIFGNYQQWCCLFINSCLTQGSLSQPFLCGIYWCSCPLRLVNKCWNSSSPQRSLSHFKTYFIIAHLAAGRRDQNTSATKTLWNQLTCGGKSEVVTHWWTTAGFRCSLLQWSSRDSVVLAIWHPCTQQQACLTQALW